MLRPIACLLALSACVSPTTQEGCPIYLSEMLQAETRACQQAYYEEMARKHGGVVSKCFPDGSGAVTCVTY